MHVYPLQANHSKESLRKFMDSVLQKQAKMRSLSKDLDDHYHQDDMAVKPRSKLLHFFSITCFRFPLTWF